MFTSLLLGQLKKHFKSDDFSPELSDFLLTIDQTYKQHEEHCSSLKKAVEQKISDEPMPSSEIKYKTLFEKMPDGIYKSSRDGKFLEVNPAMVKMLGYASVDELLQLDIKRDLYFEKNEREEATQQDNTNNLAVFRLKKKDGSELWVEERGQYIHDEDGSVLYHEGLLRDVTERVIAERELRKSNRELDKFVYSVSHDLRAPLSSMLGIIDISIDDTQDQLMIKHLLMLKNNINKLDGFITDILDYSRNARLEIKKEKIDFKGLLNDITNHLQYMGASQRVVDIKVDIHDDAAVYSDKNRLAIILNNLVSNAIRYQNVNVPNPFVNVKIDTSDTETDIVIRDNGIGIRKELHNKIFDMFYRVSEESVGSGLGLYLVKEAVAKLEGQIIVESDVGKGTSFTIKIPNYQGS